MIIYVGLGQGGGTGTEKGWRERRLTSLPATCLAAEHVVPDVTRPRQGLRQGPRTPGQGRGSFVSSGMTRFQPRLHFQGPAQAIGRCLGQLRPIIIMPISPLLERLEGGESYRNHVLL